LHLNGWEVKSVPEQAVYHHSGFSLPEGAGQKVYLNYRNSLLMMLKNYETATLWKRLPIRLLFDSIAIIRFLRLGDFAGVWGIKKAYFWLMIHPCRIRRMRKKVQRQRRLPDRSVERVIFPGSIVWSHFKLGVNSFSELDWDISDPAPEA
jgi:hypothetical protein